MRRRIFLGLAAAITARTVRADDPSREEPGRSPARQEGRGSVTIASYGKITEDFRPGIDAALASLTGLPGTDAWRRLFRPPDRVAIKLNCLAAPRLSPCRGIVEALIDGIMAAGVPPSAIVVFDRTSREIERAGFPIQTGDREVRSFGTDALKGGGYGPGILEHRSIGSLFTRILTEHATVLVNIGVCKDHDLSGVSAGCKNLYGLIHNPNRYHANRCDPFLADLVDHPAVRGKLRLTVIDAIEAQCQGGPAFSPNYIFRPGKILMSRDPVALDRIAWDLIEEERLRRGLPSLAEADREPTWIASASRLGLGEADRDRIIVHEVEG